MRRSDLLACALVVTLGAGCAAKATTVEAHRNRAQCCGGVLSCSVEFVGDVVAFPFRLTAGVIGAIF